MIKQIILLLTWIDMTPRHTANGRDYACHPSLNGRKEQEGLMEESIHGEINGMNTNAEIQLVVYMVVVAEHAAFFSILKDQVPGVL